MPDRDRINTTLDHSLTERIDAIAEARDESRSATIERMLRNQIAEEEKMLEQLGIGIEGRIMAFLLNNPKALDVMSKIIGESLTDEERARLETGGSDVVAAGKRYRSYKARNKKGNKS
ncbi:MAG: ribbon-helix-helix protein, CopG family [Phycisphaerales bacterium]|nr:ribbon-helix-helix protein, CopG family [Phycisphaerales bacterium]